MLFHLHKVIVHPVSHSCFTPVHCIQVYHLVACSGFSEWKLLFFHQFFPVHQKTSNLLFSHHRYQGCLTFFPWFFHALRKRKWSTPEGLPFPWFDSLSTWQHCIFCEQFRFGEGDCMLCIFYLPTHSLQELKNAFHSWRERIIAAWRWHKIHIFIR